jgi:hypothetical protein
MNPKYDPTELAEVCPACAGSGWVEFPGKRVPCGICGGAGVLPWKSGVCDMLKAVALPLAVGFLLGVIAGQLVEVVL